MKDAIQLVFSNGNKVSLSNINTPANC